MFAEPPPALTTNVDMPAVVEAGIWLGGAILIVAVPVVGRDASVEDIVTVPIDAPPPTVTADAVEVTFRTGLPVTCPVEVTGILIVAVPLAPLPIETDAKSWPPMIVVVTPAPCRFTICG